MGAEYVFSSLDSHMFVIKKSRCVGTGPALEVAWESVRKKLNNHPTANTSREDGYIMGMKRHIACRHRVNSAS